MAPKGKGKASEEGQGSKQKVGGSSSGGPNMRIPPRRFGKQVVEEHGLDWYNTQLADKYMGDEYVNQQSLQEMFPTIYDGIYNLCLQYIFVDQGECNLTLVREFYANWNTENSQCNSQVVVRGKRVRVSTRAWNRFLGTPNCPNAEHLTMIEHPPYRDIRHTLCGENSTVRWNRSRETGQHATLPYSHLNLEARVWLKIVSSVILPGKHTTEVTRDRVILIYRLMKGLPVNVGYILRHNMMKSRNNKRWRYCYRILLTRYLRTLEIEEECQDLTAKDYPHLVCHLVDVTKVKAPEPEQGPIMTNAVRQARDDSWMGRMFGMAEMQLRLGGRPATEEEMAALPSRYPLTESAMHMCRVGPGFQEPLDDDEPTEDEEEQEQEQDIAALADADDAPADD